MEIKTLKRGNSKKVILGVVAVVGVFSALIYVGSRAKYRVTQSVQLGEGSINYTLADLNVTDIILINEGGNEVTTNTIPESGYTLNSERSKCLNKDGNVGGTVDYREGKLYFGDVVEKGIKCTVYFNKILDSEVPVISNVAVEKGDTSIKVTVTASDNTGIDKYYYQIGTNTVEESTTNEHTFSGLTKGQKYSVKIYVTDAAGNQSSVWSGELSTKTSIDTIIAGNNPKPGTNSFTKAATTAADSGFFSTTDDDGTTYYYRGIHNSVNNWVEFAGFKWRIIRTNGDGSIRIIYNGTSTTTTGTGTQISTSAFNTQYNHNRYVGYMYGASANDYASTHTNTTSSTIKGVLDNWYKTNIVDRNYDSYVSKEAGFCGDRQVQSIGGSYTGNGGGTSVTSYAPWARLYSGSAWKTTQTPTYSCNTNDLYTVAASSKGNKKLTYPVGLITSDEVVYAGGFGGTANQQFWLYTNQYYWTMSPSYLYTSGDAYVFYVRDDGNLNNTSVNGTYGVRPVINLSADVNLTGSGTTSDPFKVSSE